MANEATDRVRQMKREQRRDIDAACASTGTSIVVVKNAVVESAYSAMGLRLKAARKSTLTVDRSAWNAGQAAGESVNLSRSLAGASVSGRIGNA